MKAAVGASATNLAMAAMGEYCALPGRFEPEPSRKEVHHDS